MSECSDAALYQRGIATLTASWGAYARGAPGAVVKRLPGITAAVFPSGPERTVYNNAILDRDLSAPERTDALDAMQAVYADAGVGHFAAWVHERDTGMRAEIERRGFALDTSTRAMAMPIGDIPSHPEVELGTLDWSEYLRLFGMPPGLLQNADHAAFHLAVARLNGENAATALAFDHDGDCGVYNVVTLEHARRRGLGTALTKLQLHDARARGCTTASLQSTPMAERVYAAAGFRDLGRIFEYIPPHDEAAQR